MRNACTHKYSLDCCSPFAFHVSRRRLRTPDFATAVFTVFVIVKHSKVMFFFFKPIILSGGTYSHKQIFKSQNVNFIVNSDWVGGKRKVESGVIVTASVCVCVCV